jgi:hypothetical protein
MLMYLELSRPDGHITRWEKVLNRLTLFNKNYPLKIENCHEPDNLTYTEYPMVKKFLLSQDVVFFGSFAFSKYVGESTQTSFDVLSENAHTVARELKKVVGGEDVVIKRQNSIGEIVSKHYQVISKGIIIATIYEPLACHSYNTLRIKKGQNIKIATIDTMISFYLAFVYAGRDYYDKTRILCMAQSLFEIQQKNRLKQRGLFKRFSMECYGKQETLTDIRNKKSKKFRELRGKKTTREYQEWFLRYRPRTRRRTKNK